MRKFSNVRICSRHLRAARTAFLVAIALALSLTADIAGSQTAPPNHVAASAGALTEVPQQPLVVRGRTYIPVYSSVMTGGGRTRLDFSVTLSIHNASERRPLVVERIDYFDTNGAIIDRYLSHNVALKPYGTVQIVVAQKDIRGGLGANFVVDWSSIDEIDEPIIEAIMISTSGTQGYGFTSVGRRITRP